MDAALRIVVRRPGLVLACVGVLTLLAATRVVDPFTGELRLRLDASANALLPEEDEDERYYESVRRRFGNDEMLMVALQGEGGVFRPENLETIRRVTRRLEAVDGVHHVVSLANALNIHSDGRDLVIEPFLERVPEDEAGLRRLREQVERNPAYAGTLLSKDGDATALLVYLRDMPEEEMLARDLDRRILDVVSAEVEAQGDGQTLWMTGGPHVKAETARILLGDLQRILPQTVLLVALVAFVWFRTARGVLVPLATILVALVWTLAIVAASGIPLNLVTTVVPPLVLVIGFAYAIHVVSAYERALRAEEPAGGGRGGPALAALREVALPTLLTGATTAAGFVSLATSPLGAIRQFGVFSTLGVGMTVLAALVFAPALLAVLPAPRSVRPERERRRVERLLDALAEADLRHRRAILWSGAAVALLAVLAIPQVRVNSAFLGNLPEESDVRRHFEAINERFHGSGTLNVVLHADYRDAFKEPRKLREIEALQTWLASDPAVGGSTSLVDYLKLIHRGFYGEAAGKLSIPESKRLVTQLFFFGANEELESFVDSTYQTANVLVRTSAIDSRDVAALVGRIEERLETLPEQIEGRVTGNTVLIARTMDDIAWGQALSLASAFVFIFAILAMLFTSLRTGFLALLPNALPVLAYFGILGATGMALSPTNGLVACMVLGIAVDDTIHYLTHFNRAARECASEERGVREALRCVAAPVTCTSLALCLGFLVLTTSRLEGQAQFGALAAATLAFAWLLDMSFTPALAARLRIVSLWDVLTLDLGEAPERSIPLFQGLSKTQARIAALMATIREVPKGQRVLRLGEAGDEMYVVVDGVLSSSVPSERGRVSLNRHGRGEVLGEVGLFQGRRSADVEAETDARLIRLTLADLERLRRRYPRIAAQLYRNLNDILARRLVRATDRLR